MIAYFDHFSTNNALVVLIKHIYAKLLRIEQTLTCPGYAEKVWGIVGREIRYVL